jgi:hypothetical protein
MASITGIVGGLNWIRIGLVATIAVLIFGAGYQYSNTKHAEQDAKDAAATAQKIAELSQQHAAEMQELAAVAAEKERLFAADIAEINLHRDALIESIRAAQLTKPVAEVRVEECFKGEQNENIVVANPFSDSFRVLWNQTARNLRPSGSTGTDPE